MFWLVIIDHWNITPTFEQKGEFHNVQFLLFNYCGDGEASNFVYPPFCAADSDSVALFCNWHHSWIIRPAHPRGIWMATPFFRGEPLWLTGHRTLIQLWHLGWVVLTGKVCITAQQEGIHLTMVSNAPESPCPSQLTKKHPEKQIMERDDGKGGWREILRHHYMTNQSALNKIHLPDILVLKAGHQVQSVSQNLFLTICTPCHQTLAG